MSHFDADWLALQDEFAGAFGELVTYKPAGLPPRELTATVRSRQRVSEDGATITDMEELEVVCHRDESSSFGGVAVFRSGDIILRSVTIDNDRRPFAFSGEVISNDGSSMHAAVFIRPRPIQRGPGQ